MTPLVPDFAPSRTRPSVQDNFEGNPSSIWPSPALPRGPDTRTLEDEFQADDERENR